jgi:hypothetical protein
MEAAMKLDIIDITHHRNGISGAPFHVAIFNDGESIKLAVVFSEPGHCAVFDFLKIAEANIRFGENSFRGDCYEPSLRQLIQITNQKGS